MASKSGQDTPQQPRVLHKVKVAISSGCGRGNGAPLPAALRGFTPDPEDASCQSGLFDGMEDGFVFDEDDIINKDNKGKDTDVKDNDVEDNESKQDMGDDLQQDTGSIENDRRRRRRRRGRSSIMRGNDHSMDMVIQELFGGHTKSQRLSICGQKKISLTQDPEFVITAQVRLSR